MNDPNEFADVLAAVKAKQVNLEAFANSIAYVFRSHRELTQSPPLIHSVKSRTKQDDSICDKIRRKAAEGTTVTPSNVFTCITDLTGVRVLHLHQAQFAKIHAFINEQLEEGIWALHEDPKAYIWDPESRTFFESFGLLVEVKETFYTSIHYVVKPREESELCCEVQVRTLFEEIWGEIDHRINYPHATEIMTCREQLRVLARLVGAGSRLADSIFRSFEGDKEGP